MARDKLAEIAAVRGRGQSGAWRATHVITELHERSTEGLAYPAAFIVIRLVTALEVFTRAWVKELVDAGEPYIGRAAELLKGTLKIDFAMAQGLVGKQVTFGDLVAHEIPLNGVADLERVFTHLLGRSVFERLRGVVNRWDVEVLGKPATPILVDPTEARARLQALFELRHIHVHELPDKAHIEPETVTAFLFAAMSFCDALDQALSTEIHGHYPLTQLDMNNQAGARAHEAEEALQTALALLDPGGTNDQLRASQVAWETYRELQSEFASDVNNPMAGSIARLVYASEIERITRARIEEIKGHLTRDEGEM